MEQSEAWSHQFTQQVVGAVRAQRQQRGWSTQEFADRLTAAGMSTHRSSLANMENGRRAGITVAEWLAFAYVLDVPPLALLFPQLPDGAVEPLPGVSLDRTSAVSWLATGRLSGDTDSAYHDAVREAFRAMERDRAARVRLAEAALDA